MMQKQLGKIADIFTGNKAVAQNCASSCWFPHLHALCFFLLKFLIKKLKFINFIKLYPMNTCLFSILCAKTESYA